MTRALCRLACVTLLLAAHQGAVFAAANCPTSQDDTVGSTTAITKPGAWDGWIELERYVPRSDQQPDPVMTTLPVNQAAGQIPGRSVFALAANEQTCAAADSIRWGWELRAVHYSRLAYLAYFSDSDVRALERKRQELLRKAGTSGVVDIEPGRAPGALQKIEAAECALATRLGLKDAHLTEARFSSRQDLIEEFKREAGLTQERLDAMGFHAEVYSRDDNWVLVFRGTVGGVGGWATNLAQILSMANMVDNGSEDKNGAVGQYGVADKLVKHLLRRGVPRDKLYTTGHSLGGGLASYTHLSNNLAGALMFNPAQLGVASRRQLETLPHYGSAQTRMANYMSQSRTEMNDSDIVSQGTATASAVLSKVDINVPSWGSLHGATFYIPIDEEPVPAKFKAAVFGVGAYFGVFGTAPAAVAAAAGAEVYSASNDKDGGSAAARVGAGTAVATHAMKLPGMIRNPALTAIKAVGGGLVANSLAKVPLEFAWHEYLLHSMQPLATALASSGLSSVTTTCAASPDPQYIQGKSNRKRGMRAQLAEVSHSPRSAQ